jgi:hypothetical protein
MAICTFALNAAFMSLRTPVFLFLLLLCNGCSNRETIDPQPFDASQLEYFPLKSGKYIVYQVDSLVFDPAISGGIALDSSSTFVLEMMTDSLPDNNGRLQYILERYERKQTSEPWTFKFAGTLSRTNGQGVRTEQNLRFLKMLFPMDKRSHWDGNLWIDENREIEIAGERMLPFIHWSYAVDSIDVPAEIGGFRFDSTLVITEADNDNVIEKRFSRAWYAKNIGLVKREQWILDSQYCNQIPAPADCTTRPWELKAEKGYILRQVILEHN